MLNTNKQIKKVVLMALFAVIAIPTLASADITGSYGSDSYDYGGWGGNSPTYDYDYSPNYSYTPSYDSYGGGYDSGSYYTPSYGGSSYIPSYGTSYSGSSIPSSNYTSNDNSNSNKNNNKNNNSNKNTNTNTSNSSSNSSSSANAVVNSTNVNNNNVYVYTNPTGNAVVYNPAHINLNGYCTIVPSNPRLGQTVTATAYAAGGTGYYTYSWGGDIYSATGASTSFTSYTPGTKTIIVTIRSDSEVITKTCDVTFENGSSNNNDLSATCYANPTNANVNQVVTWTVNANGGSGSYSYNWSGTDNLTGYNQYVARQYSYPGTKTAQVTVSSNGRSITTNCSTNVNGYNGTTYTGSSVNVTPNNITSGTPVSGVYLSQLPATGLSLTFVDYMIAAMVMVLAAVFAFVYQARKRLLVENI